MGYYKGKYKHGFEKQNIINQLNNSLKNLQSDYIDIYFLHHSDFGINDMYLSEVINQLNIFKQQGKIRFVGLRVGHQFSPEKKKMSFYKKYKRFIYLSKLIKPDVISCKYNMIDSSFDENKFNIFKLAEEKDLGVIIYKPLAQGLLLGKHLYYNPPTFSNNDNRSKKFLFTSKGLKTLHPCISKIKKYFNCKTNADLAKLSIIYCLSTSQKSVPVVGFKNREQLEETLSIKSKNLLSKNDLLYIKNIFSEIRR